MSSKSNFVGNFFAPSVYILSKKPYIPYEKKYAHIKKAAMLQLRTYHL
jgi:hypothetical protein